MISTPSSHHGLAGYIKLLASTDSIPESLQRLGLLLTNKGFTTDICAATPSTRWPGQAVAGTTTGWLLTWSRITRSGLAECGSLWVAHGGVLTTLSISE